MNEHRKKNKIWSQPLKYTWFPLNVVSAMCSKILKMKVQRHGDGHAIQKRQQALCAKDGDPRASPEGQAERVRRWGREEVAVNVHTHDQHAAQGLTLVNGSPGAVGIYRAQGKPQEASLLQRTGPGSRRAWSHQNGSSHTMGATKMF